MRICPICKLKYADDKVFCDRCRAYLEPMKDHDAQDEKKVPFNGKRVLVAIVCMVAFMAFIMVLYYILGTWGK